MVSPAWSYIVVHCADTPNSLAHWEKDAYYGYYDVLAIDAWHYDRGFRRDTAIAESNRPHLKSVGYHKVIEISGAVAQGRSFIEVGAHAGESQLQNANARAIGICLIGRDAYTEAQWWALKREVEIIRAMVGPMIPEENIIGHCDIAPHKTCPGFDVQKWLKGGMNIPMEHLCSRKVI